MDEEGVWGRGRLATDNQSAPTRVVQYIHGHHPGATVFAGAPHSCMCCINVVRVGKSCHPWKGPLLSHYKIEFSGYVTHTVFTRRGWLKKHQSCPTTSLFPACCLWLWLLQVAFCCRFSSHLAVVTRHYF